MSALSRFIDHFRGSGDYSVSVPPFDGALRPNERLETALAIVHAPEPDNLVTLADGVVFSSADSLFRIDSGSPAGSHTPAVPLHRLPSTVTALASRDETLAIGLEKGGVVILGGHHDGMIISALDGIAINCPTALAFQDADALLIANGSASHPPSRWKSDLLDGGASGTVSRIDLATRRSTRLAANLAFPLGLLPLGDGGLLVSESWRHRLVRIDVSGQISRVLENLPAYPGRLAPCREGGAWLALFAPRRRLVEFVLREPAYRQRMMREIPSEYWVAPTLRPMMSFLEPLQGGMLKQLARLKPWAPSRSYGLVVRLDANFLPVESLHSRADGCRHGVRSVLEVSAGLLAASVGADAVVLVPPPREH